MAGGKVADDKKVDKDRVDKDVELLAPADKETMQAMSELLNSKLTLFPDPQTRTWYKLFQRIDNDHSGRISYYEFKGFVRQTLELNQERLPDAKLKAVWKALDADGGGYITVAEFG